MNDLVQSVGASVGVSAERLLAHATRATPSKTYDVVGFGAMNMDQLVSIAALPTRRDELTAQSAHFTPGGSASNTIYGLARLGARTSLLGVVGEDDNGAVLRQSLEENQIDTTLVTVKPGSRTGLAVVLSSRKGDRVSILVPGANSALEWRDLEPKLPNIANARILHMSSFAEPANLSLQTRLALELTKAGQGPLISLSPGQLYARRPQGELDELLRCCFVVILNMHEIRDLTRRKDISRACLQIHELGVRYVVVTFGAGIAESEIRGGAREKKLHQLGGEPSNATVSAIISSVDQLELVPSIGSQRRTKTFDTTGAGDAFAAGVLWGVLRGLPVEDWGRIGRAMSLLCVRNAGSRAGFPMLPELNRFYAKLYQRPLDDAPLFTAASGGSQMVRLMS